MTKNTLLLQLMHDISGPANRIKSLIPLIETEPKSDDRASLLSMVDRSANEINKALDAYYTLVTESKVTETKQISSEDYTDGNGY